MNDGSQMLEFACLIFRFCRMFLLLMVPGIFCVECSSLLLKVPSRGMVNLGGAFGFIGCSIPSSVLLSLNSDTVLSVHVLLRCSFFLSIASFS